MSEELTFQVALELIPNVGNKGIKQLLRYCDTASEVFRSSKSQLLKIPGIGEKIAHAIKHEIPFKKAEAILQSADKIGAEILHFTNPLFPEKLRQIPDSPNIIYKKGAIKLNFKRSVAIVGTRKATQYGKDITERIVHDMRTMDVAIISGFAYGIDIYAHKESLKNNIPTIAVLAGGLDHIYPSVHKKYTEEILEQGGLITESIPGTKSDSHLFPARNRIIAGLADVTIVVEAAVKGGALITANIANSYNRMVFAVPGNIGHTYSEGTNKLIACHKASIYTGIEDLIYHLNWDMDNKQQKSQKLPELTEDEQKIYDLLLNQQQPLEIDLIAMTTQIPVNKVASHLLNMEFNNLIKSIPGKKYKAIS